MIAISIDVTLLDKTRFKEVTRRSGDKAKFCDLILIDTPNSPHGEFIVKQEVTKEERAQRVEMPILGNGKTIGKKKPQSEQDYSQEPPPRRQQEQPRQSQQPPRSAGYGQRRQQPDPDLDAPEDDIPF